MELVVIALIRKQNTDYQTTDKKSVLCCLLSIVSLFKPIPLFRLFVKASEFPVEGPVGTVHSAFERSIVFTGIGMEKAEVRAF